MIKDPEDSEGYLVRVVAIQPFGAFIELLPGKDGLLHISRMANGRVGKVEDVLNIGDEVTVKIIEIDSRDKISLDRLNKPEAPASSAPREEGHRSHDKTDGRRNGNDRTAGYDDKRPRRRH